MFYHAGGSRGPPRIVTLRGAARGSYLETLPQHFSNPSTHFQILPPIRSKSIPKLVQILPRPSQILPKASQSLRKIDPKHSRIRRSTATRVALATIIKEIPQPSDGRNISISKYPRVLPAIIRRINWIYLRRKIDLKLVPKYIWQIYFRKTYGKLNVVPSKDTTLLHSAIYIQRRHSTPAEIALGRQKRVNSKHPHPISNELVNIQSVTTIDQTGSIRLLYSCTDLHSRPHGSIHHKDIRNKNTLYQSLGIKHKTLSTAQCGPRRVLSYEDVTVAFDGAAFMKYLRKSLFRKCKVDL